MICRATSSERSQAALIALRLDARHRYVKALAAARQVGPGLLLLSPQIHAQHAAAGQSASRCGPRRRRRPPRRCVPRGCDRPPGKTSATCPRASRKRTLSSTFATSARSEPRVHGHALVQVGEHPLPPVRGEVHALRRVPRQCAEVAQVVTVVAEAQADHERVDHRQVVRADRGSAPPTRCAVAGSSRGRLLAPPHRPASQSRSA